MKRKFQSSCHDEDAEEAHIEMEGHCQKGYIYIYILWKIRLREEWATRRVKLKGLCKTGYTAQREGGERWGDYVFGSVELIG